MRSCSDAMRWYVVDMGSTNGTYVGGRRIEAEAPLTGAPDVRFGGVKFIFRVPEGAAGGNVSQTRAIAALKVNAGRTTAEVKTPAVSQPGQRAAPTVARAAPAKKSSRWLPCSCGLQC